MSRKSDRPATVGSGPGGTGERLRGGGTRSQHSPAWGQPSTLLPKGATSGLQRCQCARRDALPPTPARRVGFRSRVRGVSAIVASLALEAEQGTEDAWVLGHCAYELARVAAGLKAVIA